jgi:hypothetical protein
MTNKPMCVLCHVPLYKLESEDYQWICSKDRSHKYQLFYEVMSYDNDFGTVLGEEEENQIELAGLEGVGEPLLLSANDNEFEDSNDKNNGDIKIPKYMKDSETSKVTYFREE